MALPALLTGTVVNSTLAASYEERAQLAVTTSRDVAVVVNFARRQAPRCECPSQAAMALHVSKVSGRSSAAFPRPP